MMTDSQVYELLVALRRIAEALERLAAVAPAAPPISETHIVEQPLTINLPRTEATHR